MKELGRKPLRVVNVGLEIFEEELKNQSVPVMHVRWRPPAGGKPHLLEILEKLEELDK